MEPKDILNNIEKYYILNQKKNDLLHMNNLLAILKLNREQTINNVNTLEKKEKEVNDTITKAINVIIDELKSIYNSKCKIFESHYAKQVEKYNKSVVSHKNYETKLKLFSQEDVLSALKNEVFRNKKKIEELDRERSTIEDDYVYIYNKLIKGFNDDSVFNEQLKEKISKFINNDENDNIIKLYDNLLELIASKNELNAAIDKNIKLKESNDKEIETLENNKNELEKELTGNEEINIKESLTELSNILTKVNEHDKIIEDVKKFMTKCGGFTTEIYKKAGSAVKVATSVVTGNAEEVFDTCVDEIGNSLGIDPKITSNGKVLAKNMFENLKKMKNEKKENKQDNNEE